MNLGVALFFVISGYCIMASADATRTSLDVTAQGRYTYKFEFNESGTFHAANGTWTQNRQGGTPLSGNYKFNGPDQVSAADA